MPEPKFQDAMKSIGVFCAARAGSRPEYVDLARETGGAIARRGLRLVYGGGGRGLMGALADGALEAGGEVTGVIPAMLVTQEKAHRGVEDQRIVETMLERKTVMAELSDAFLALPGGLGTMDELFEMLTWTQLGLQRKRCALLNAFGCYDGLIAWLDRTVEDGFVSKDIGERLIIGSSLDRALDGLAGVGV